MKPVPFSRALAAVLCVAGAACGQGYPSDAPPQRPPTPQERVEIVRRVVGANPSEIRSIVLADPCTLEVRWKNQARSVHPVLDLDPTVESDPATKHFRVTLVDRRTGERSPLVVATPDWAEMVQVRGELNQLRAECARWRERAM